MLTSAFSKHSFYEKWTYKRNAIKSVPDEIFQFFSQLEQADTVYSLQFCNRFYFSEMPVPLKILQLKDEQGKNNGK